MVECECSYRIVQLIVIQVLIDTWWNVNRLLYAHKVSRDLVLIDTWWNVNDKYQYLDEEIKSF